MRMREQFTCTKVIHSNEEGRKIWYTNKRKGLIKTWKILNENSLLLTCYNESDSLIDSNGNIALALFTTAQARLKTFAVMEEYGERLIYGDTDSVFLIVRPGDKIPDLGNYLGDLTSELDVGGWITQFTSGGLKQYLYITKDGKREVRCKGVNMHRGDVLSQLQFDEFKAICRGQLKKEITFGSITRDGLYGVGSKSDTKKTLGKEVLQKRNFRPGGTSEPWKECDRPLIQETILRLKQERQSEKILPPPGRGLKRRLVLGHGEAIPGPVSKVRKCVEGGEHVVYFLMSNKGGFHIGYTQDLEYRVQCHNGKGKVGSWLG